MVLTHDSTVVVKVSHTTLACEAVSGVLGSPELTMATPADQPLCISASEAQIVCLVPGIWSPTLSMPVLSLFRGRARDIPWVHSRDL